MSEKIGRFLCRIGSHRWQVIDRGLMWVEIRCARCGRIDTDLDV
jgi:hypothetical protein